MIIYNVKNFLESRTSTLRISGRANYLVTFLVCMIQLNLQRTTYQICGRAEISDFSKRVCARRLGGGGGEGCVLGREGIERVNAFYLSVQGFKVVFFL